MTLSDLIEQLQDLANEHGPQTEVQIAHQPSWPFAYSISQIVAASNSEFVEVSEDELAEWEDEGRAAHEKYRQDAEELADTVVYIGEGSQLGYLPTPAVTALDWGRGS